MRLVLRTQGASTSTISVASTSTQNRYLSTVQVQVLSTSSLRNTARCKIKQTSNYIYSSCPGFCPDTRQYNWSICKDL